MGRAARLLRRRDPALSRGKFECRAGATPQGVEAQGMPGGRWRSLLFMRRSQRNRNNAGESLLRRESLGEQAAPAQQATPCCFWLPRWARVCQEPPLTGLLAC